MLYSSGSRPFERKEKEKEKKDVFESYGAIPSSSHHLWCLCRSQWQGGTGRTALVPTPITELTKPFEVGDAQAFVANLQNVGVGIDIALFTKPEVCFRSVSVSE